MGRRRGRRRRRRRRRAAGGRAAGRRARPRWTPARCTCSGVATGLDGSGRLVVELPGGGRTSSTPATCPASRGGALRRGLGLGFSAGCVAGIRRRRLGRLGAVDAAAPPWPRGAACASGGPAARRRRSSAAARPRCPRSPWRRRRRRCRRRPRARAPGRRPCAGASGARATWRRACRRRGAVVACDVAVAVAAAPSTVAVATRVVERLLVGPGPRLRRAGGRAPGGRCGRLLAPAPRAAALALGEVAQQLARQRARLAGQARARAAQDLLGLGRVRDRGGEQRGLQAAVLLARGVHEPARVARVRAAGGVHEQPEQALGLRPALDRVLLVDLARVLGQAPDPGVGLVAAADALLGQRLEQDLGALAALVARPACR